ncbi:6,7-dimethyl-8-ribityllumazine synthase [bacterium]|nr:6,7-dimethyl-8-ribityllumazine synthase [bacterium]
MAKTIEGQLQAKGKKFGLLISRFNEFITHRLLEGALDCIYRHGGSETDIDIVWVPGSFEMPVIAKKMANSGKYDAVICLAAVIQGGTPHFQYVAAEVTKGIAQVALESETPTIYGVLTCDTLDQAVERAGTKQGNKGWNAALAAIEMADLIGRLSY